MKVSLFEMLQKKNFHDIQIFKMHLYINDYV